MAGPGTPERVRFEASAHVWSDNFNQKIADLAAGRNLSILPTVVPRAMPKTN
jgi:hypothetical protein